MPRTKESDAVEQAELVADNATYAVHTVIRGLGVQNVPGQNVFTSEAVDAYLKSWFEDGWRLHSTHCPGQTKDAVGGAPVYNMVYVLVKE